MDLIQINKIIKDLKTYGKKYGVDVQINSIETDDDGCEELLELYFDDNLPLTNGYTMDDCISYKITNTGLFLKFNYQRDDLKDLPLWINDKKTIKELIRFFSI
ncbi:hypothetical protein [Sulfurospirillum oryzae]|uniref:hypothetical protein n=1 Tax=Sulfurospirillum oryzae TaxID=2976535 RepID=UPI0021E71E4E|nr:hypothetical protein [Sulfurospirillum oryzae]